MKKILAIALLMVIHHQLIMAAPNTTPENFTPEQLHQLELDEQQLARVTSRAAQGIDPQYYADARNLAKSTGQPIDSILRDQKPQQVTDQWSSLETISPSTAQMFRDMDKAKLAGRRIEEPKFGSKEWAMGITQKIGDAASTPIKIFMSSIAAAIVICLFAFFLIFSIFPSLIKKFPIKGKFRLAFTPFFPSLIIFLFADLLPELEFDGEIEYDARYYVLIFSFLLSCWIVWRRAKDQQMDQKNNA